MIHPRKSAFLWNFLLAALALTLGSAGCTASDRENEVDSGAPELTGDGSRSDGSSTGRVYGVTVTSTDNLQAIVASLQGLSQRPTARIVFDEFVPASEYVTAARRIHSVSGVMGELLDSYYVKEYSVNAYLARTREYLDTLGNDVDIWEVGNEINGEWLEGNGSVVDKMAGAYDLVKARGKKTALTLYYNHECWSNPRNEMFTWALANVPERMKQGLDYVFVSYYEDDCNDYQPDWPAVFQRLGQIFPNSLIGIGECGTTDAASKTEFIRRYYSMSIDHPRFIGGFFWWYFNEDMVPKTRPLWGVLNDSLSQ